MEGLVPRSIAFAFGRGVDTKNDEEALDVASPVVLENAQFDRAGALNKRPGYTSLPAIPGLADLIAQATLAPPMLTALDDELLLIADNALLGWSESLGAWGSRGAVYSPEVRTQGLYASPTEQLRPDCATDGRLTVYVYEEGSTVKLTVTDEVTGAVIAAHRSVGTGGRPCVESVGPGRFLVFSRSAGNVQVATLTVTSTSFTLGALTTLVSTLSTSWPFFQVARLGGAVVLAWATSTGIGVQYVTPAGVLGDPSNGYFAPAAVGVATPASALALGILQDRYIFIGYSDSGGNIPRVLVLDQNLSSVVADTALASLGSDVASQMTWSQDQRTDGMRLWYERRNTDATYNASVWSSRVLLSGSVSAAAIAARSVGLATKGFYRGGKSLVGVTYESTLQPTLFFINTGGYVIARTLVGKAGGLLNSYPWTTPGLPSVRLVGDKAVTATQYRTRYVAQPGGSTNAPRAVTRVSVDFARERFRSARAAELLHIAGGSPSIYDGTQVVEAGFHVFPELSVEASNWAFQIEKLDTYKFKFYLPPDQPLTPKLACGAQIRAGSYLCIFHMGAAGVVTTKAYCYFTVDGVGSDPALNGFDLTFVCALNSADDQETVANKLATAVTTFGIGTGSFPYFAGRVVNTGTTSSPVWTCEIDDTSYAGGVYRPFDCDDTTLCVSTLVVGDGSHVPVNYVVTPSAHWIEPGRYLVLETTVRTVSITGNLPVAFYFTVDGVGTAPTNIPGNRTVAVAILSTDTPNQVGVKLANAINGFTEGGTSCFTAAAASSGPLVTVTNIGNGALSTDTAGGGGGPLVGGPVLPDARPQFVYAGAGPISTGIRQYRATYEWTDARGKLHRSAPSTPLQATTLGAVGQGPPSRDPATSGGSHGVARVTATTLRLSAKSGVNVVFWRQTSGGTTFYRLATVANDPTVNSVTFQDTIKDTDLTSQETLYTLAELPNGPPPASVEVVTWQDRLWWGGLDAIGSLWYSKVVQPPVDLLAPAFSEALQVELDTRGGRVVALAVLEDSLVVFQERRILVFSGQGANNAGDLAQFLPARTVSADLGCLSADSVVVTPGGLLFQSSKGGIYLLDRGFQVQYVGAPVEALTRAGGVVTSAVSMPQSTQVRFTFAADQGLVFDYHFGQWASFTRYESTGALALRGEYFRVRSDGLVLRETPGVFLDLGVPVQFRVVTPWIHPAELVQGFGRIWRALVLARYRSGHKLELRFAFDGNTDDVETRTFDAAEAFGGNLFGSSTPFGSDSPFGAMNFGGAYQVRAHLRRQKCRALRVTVLDYPTPDGGEAVQLLGLALEAGVIAQVNKLPTSRTMRRP